jgi:hypothetical protein
MTRKRIIILISILAAVSLASAGGWFYFHQAQKKQTGQNIAPKKEEVKLDPVTFGQSDYGASQRALASKNPETCKEISSQIGIDTCLSAVALALGKEEVCAQISSAQKKEECLSFIKRDQIEKSGKPGDCASVKTETARIACYSEFFQKMKDKSECAGLSGDALKFCQNEFYHREGSEQRNKELCSKIEGNDGLKTDCLKLSEEPAADTDGDGVDDDTEKSLGLDMFKADTDGDGISDLEELQAMGGKQ